jgi:aconitate hydratase
MINGLGVLGWGVGGIEAEAAMLGQPVSMLLPEVIGFKLTGKLKEGVTATDLVLTVVQMLRKKGVVGEVRRILRPGLDNMSLADRATIGNMGPEYGATCGFFPVDGETINYLTMSGRTTRTGSRWSKPIRRRRACGATGDGSDLVFTDTLELDLGDVVPAMAGPKRPEGRVALEGIAAGFAAALEADYKKPGQLSNRYAVEGTDYDLGHGDVAIAAITSCTNTSNPSVLIAAGLLARNAVAKGLKSKPWVKTSLAPGSQVVAEYLAKSGLQTDLDKLGFNLVGFGCTTCIGNSGPLPAPISKTINDKGLIAAGVLSGNRNFEGRVSPDVQANYLASPPLVVAYALAGSVPEGPDDRAARRGQGRQSGIPQGHLADLARDPGIHPEIRHARALRDQVCRRLQGRRQLAGRQVPPGQTYAWDDNSTYVQNPPYFVGMGKSGSGIKDIKGARVPRPVRRQDHHRPHFPGRFDQGGLAGRRLSAGAPWRRRCRLQPVRHAPRQP